MRRSMPAFLTRGGGSTATGDRTGHGRPAGTLRSGHWAPALAVKRRERRPQACARAPDARAARAPAPELLPQATFELSAGAVRVEVCIGELLPQLRDSHPLHAVRCALAVVVSRALVGENPSPISSASKSALG